MKPCVGGIIWKMILIRKSSRMKSPEHRVGHPVGVIEMKRYNNFDDLSKDCPGICETIARENARQFPHAKFVVAVTGQYAIGLDEGQADLIALFDVGIPEEVLYVWGCGLLQDTVSDSQTFIDEYYVMPDLEAWQQVGLVK